MCGNIPKPPKNPKPEVFSIPSILDKRYSACNTVSHQVAAGIT
jgi:hypothetical protein